MILRLTFRIRKTFCHRRHRVEENEECHSSDIKSAKEAIHASPSSGSSSGIFLLKLDPASDTIFLQDPLLL